MANYPQVKSDIVNGVTEMDGNQINNIEDYVGLEDDTDTDTITYKLTNPDSIGPGHKHPVADLNGGTDGALVFKDPEDSGWKAWLPDTIGLITKLGEQTISAKKTFAVLPESSVTPTTADQLIRKGYFDSLVFPSVYGGMYRTNFEEVDPPLYAGYRQALRDFTSQALQGITFNAGATGAILSIVDGGNGLARIESTAHGLSTGDVISINGTEYYNGIWTVTYFSPDVFTILKILFQAETPTADSVWYKPSNLKISADGAGVYKVSVSAIVQLNEANIVPNAVELFVNATTKEELYLRAMFYGATFPYEMGLSRTAILTLAVGDILWFSQMTSEGSTVPMLISIADLTLHRVTV